MQPSGNMTVVSLTLQGWDTKNHRHFMVQIQYVPFPLKGLILLWYPRIPPTVERLNHSMWMES